MKIKKVTWQLRRDFKADYECEHCGNDYRPLAPVHPEGKQL